MSIFQGTREYQQDYICIPQTPVESDFTKKGFVAALCDGMGGMENGDLASNLCADLVVNSFYSEGTTVESIPAYYDEIVRFADMKVSEIGRQGSGVGTCGTTLVSACIKNDELYLCSVGDSSIYFIRNNRIQRINSYHNVYTELKKRLDKNEITNDYFDDVQNKHALTSYIGMNGLKYIDRNIKPIKLLIGDMIILCSDGVSGVLSEEEIKEICKNSTESLICENFMKKINNKGLDNLDNASAIVICI